MNISNKVLQIVVLDSSTLFNIKLLCCKGKEICKMIFVSLSEFLPFDRCKSFQKYMPCVSLGCFFMGKKSVNLTDGNSCLNRWTL